MKTSYSSTPRLAVVAERNFLGAESERLAQKEDFTISRGFVQTANEVGFLVHGLPQGNLNGPRAELLRERERGVCVFTPLNTAGKRAGCKGLETTWCSCVKSTAEIQKQSRHKTHRAELLLFTRRSTLVEFNTGGGGGNHRLSLQEPSQRQQ